MVRRRAVDDAEDGPASALPRAPSPPRQTAAKSPPPRTAKEEPLKEGEERKEAASSGKAKSKRKVTFDIQAPAKEEKPATNGHAGADDGALAGPAPYEPASSMLSLVWAQRSSSTSRKRRTACAWTRFRSRPHCRSTSRRRRTSHSGRHKGAAAATTRVYRSPSRSCGLHRFPSRPRCVYERPLRSPLPARRCPSWPPRHRRRRRRRRGTAVSRPSR
jgi:hypothetical protein